MNPLTAAIIGLVGSFGLLTVLVGAVPALGGNDHKRMASPGAAADDRWLLEVWERRAFPALTTALEADLAIIGQDRTAWRRHRLYYSFGSGALPACGWLVGALVFRTVSSLALALLLWAIATVAGWFAAARLIHAKAEQERREIRHALSLYLELAAVALSGGAGPAEALRAAANGGRGRAFRMMAAALAAAEVQRSSPYTALENLGRELAIAELRDVGSAMALAEEQGAPVKNTLNNKASSVRYRLMNREEAKAEAISTAMTLPSVLMLVGFLLFLMFPFVAALLATTG